jgi:AraC-like DNA-binding protein
VFVGCWASASVSRNVEGPKQVRTLNHLTDITEALRELQEGLAVGVTREAIAAQLNVSAQELERIESTFLGMSHSQIEHVLCIEDEVEVLRREIAALRQAENGGARWSSL